MITRFEQFSSAIARIYHDIQKIERVEMERFGLKGPHVQCMLALSRNPEGMTSSQLCTVCEKDKAAISRTITELEEEGMLDRDVHDGNRYRALLKLTERGKAAAAQVDTLCRALCRKDRSRDVPCRDPRPKGVCRGRDGYSPQSRSRDMP